MGNFILYGVCKSAVMVVALAGICDVDIQVFSGIGG
nr:MAG TPA: hypothetical protein [Caudoviricetes sp.]